MKETLLEKTLCKKIASAVAPYADSAPCYFHNDEKYCNVPYTDIETVAKEIARMFQSQADECEREKGEMVRDMLDIKCTWEEDEHDLIMADIRTIAQRHGVDLSE